MTPEDAAWCAAQWASGIRQKDIARQFGWRTGSSVCGAISVFLWRHTPDELWQPLHTVQGEPRKALVKAALAQFIASRASE